MKYIEVTADCGNEKLKTLICINDIMTISESNAKSKRAIICIRPKNGEKMTIKCIESYRIIKKRLLEQINEAAGKE